MAEHAPMTLAAKVERVLTNLYDMQHPKTSRAARQEAFEETRRLLQETHTVLLKNELAIENLVHVLTKHDRVRVYCVYHSDTDPEFDVDPFVYVTEGTVVERVEADWQLMNSDQRIRTGDVRVVLDDEVATSGDTEGRWYVRGVNEERPDVYYEHGRDGYHTTNILVKI